MKILFYTPVKLQSGGGCERWHCDITNSLKKQFGFDIEIISANLGYNHWSSNYLKQQLQKTPYRQLNFPILFGTIIPTPAIFVFLLKKFREADKRAEDATTVSEIIKLYNQQFNHHKNKK